MSDKVHTIYAGSHPIYEIAVVDDGLNVVIRSAEDPKRQIKIIGSCLSTLISTLQSALPELR
ncbi:hypothetical protein [Geothrix mesophila]|uniref:hypothetical protein n=1 Tax=Geothrix mesophila TaxID=2922723 RepID=UPI001FACFD8A|nr:hypothetical protein [Geothrix sp. SG198]